jgi:hypothetical protein
MQMTRTNKKDIEPSRIADPDLSVATKKLAEVRLVSALWQNGILIKETPFGARICLRMGRSSRTAKVGTR